jgi:imidazolonepropionase-like amidohydrolase
MRPIPRTLRVPLASAALALGTLGATQRALAQDLVVKAPAQTSPIALTGATIHPVSGPAIANGYVLFNEGRIVGVGETLPRLDKSIKVVDAKGRHIYPGLVGAYAQTGLVEIGMVRASNDTAEVGSNGITPEVRACVAVNPDSTLIPVTRSNGVLSIGVYPAGGVIPGRVSVISLDGWTWESMTVKDVAGLAVNWPQSRPITAWWMDRSEEDQLKDIRQSMLRIEEAFASAAAYAGARTADPATPIDVRWESMRSTLPATAKDGAGAPSASQLPVFIAAQDYDQITSAVEFAAKQGLRCVIVGGRDAPLCADLLKRHNVGVIVQGTLRMPRRDDSPYDEAYTLPMRLEEAGVKWCLASGQETAHERNLPYSAAMAAAYGLGVDAAIRSITLSAAELLGVADQLGSIEPGKRATLLVTDGSPLELTTKIEAAYIDGKLIDLSNKQTELEKKYREKYRQQQTSGKAAAK